MQRKGLKHLELRRSPGDHPEITGDHRRSRHSTHLGLAADEEALNGTAAAPLIERSRLGAPSTASEALPSPRRAEWRRVVWIEDEGEGDPIGEGTGCKTKRRQDPRRAVDGPDAHLGDAEDAAHDRTHVADEGEPVGGREFSGAAWRAKRAWRDGAMACMYHL